VYYPIVGVYILTFATSSGAPLGPERGMFKKSEIGEGDKREKQDLNKVGKNHFLTKYMPLSYSFD